ncbi:MAG: EAL domain-containing protein, partial [Vicinamibacterales bacterium]
MPADAVAELRPRTETDASVWQTAIEALLSGAQQSAVHLQPIVDLHRGTIAGYEALARFPAPPAASPDRWFLEASRYGLAVELERDVLSLAVQNLPALPGTAFLSINVSPAFLASPAWARLIASCTRLDRLVIELTEGSAVDHFKIAHTAIKMARQRG